MPDIQKFAWLLRPVRSPHGASQAAAFRRTGGPSGAGDFRLTAGRL